MIAFLQAMGHLMNTFEMEMLIIEYVMLNELNLFLRFQSSPECQMDIFMINYVRILSCYIYTVFICFIFKIRKCKCAIDYVKKIELLSGQNTYIFFFP